MYLYEKNKNIFIIILSIITSIFLESYITLVENSYIFRGIDTGNFIKLFSFKEFLVFLVIFLIIYYILFDYEKRTKVFNFIYKYRLPISFTLLAVAVILQIHGSSIGELNFFKVDHKTLFGIPRYIRSDEYNVNTMLAFSQYLNNFSYFSEIVRAVPTDMFIVYGQPVLDIGMLFRPFLIGYLFLNQGQGLSFFWMGRLIFLFLISFEFGMLITKNNKKLAVAYAILIAFSPAVQWWFAVNGLVEILIFGQLAILLIDYYMNMDDYKKRFIIALGLMVCVGTFLLVFYPSWQISFGYVFVLLAFWIFLKNRPNFKYNRKDLIILIVTLSIFSIIMAHILSNSLETIKIILHSTYPGGEVFNGGGELKALINYLPSTFFTLDTEVPISNVVELATFIDFFPIPIILTGIILFYQKTKDKLLIGLLALYIILLIFYKFQLPDLLINITLSSHIRTSRLIVVLSFIGSIMLIRSIADLKELKHKELFIILSIALSSILVYKTLPSFGPYYNTWLIPILVVLYSFAFSAIFLSYSDKGKTIFLISCIILLFSAGALVNPVDHGTDVVFKSNYIQEVQQIVNEDPNGTWIVDGLYIDSLLPVGAKTFNSVHTYPALNKWQSIDPKNETYEVYNRYAHVTTIIMNDSSSKLMLAAPDIIHLYLNVNDFEKFNISYVATSNNLSQFSNENITFIEIYHEGTYKIFKVQYS